MGEYNFDLIFRLAPGESAEKYLDPLFEAGCDDALVGSGRVGYVGLDFAREAHSAFEAITSAIAAVKQAIPHAKLTEISPDFVGVRELAAHFRVSRQYMRKLLTESEGAPTPLRGGSTEIYRFVDVVGWLLREEIIIGEIAVTELDYELADVITNFNLARERANRVFQRETRSDFGVTSKNGQGEGVPQGWSKSLIKKIGQEICPRYQKLLGEEQLRLIC